MELRFQKQSNISVIETVICEKYLNSTTTVFHICLIDIYKNLIHVLKKLAVYHCHLN